MKRPLVGASVQVLRKSLQRYSSSDEIEPLIDSIRELYQQQGTVESSKVEERRAPAVTRDDLHLMCYEYVAS